MMRVAVSPLLLFVLFSGTLAFNHPSTSSSHCRRVGWNNSNKNKLGQSCRCRCCSTTAASQARIPHFRGGGGATENTPWLIYSDALQTRPLKTKAITSMIGWALGDFVTQAIQLRWSKHGGKRSKYPWWKSLEIKRILALSFFGFLFHGPSGHFFYNWLDVKIPGRGFGDVVLKVAADQAILLPIFTTIFFIYLGLVKGDSIQRIRKTIDDDLWKVCQGSWKLWPLIHAIHFRCVETPYRVLYINVVTVALNLFVSIVRASMVKDRKKV